MLRRHLVDPVNLTSTLSLASAFHSDMIDNSQISIDPYRLSSLGSGVILDSASPEDPQSDIPQDISQLVEDLLRMPYAWWKRADPAYVNSRKIFLSSGPFKLWLSDDPLVNEQFRLEESSTAAPSKARKTTIAVKMESIADVETTHSPAPKLHNRDASSTDDISTKKARQEQNSEHGQDDCVPNGPRTTQLNQRQNMKVPLHFN